MKNLFFKLFSILCLMICVCGTTFAEEIYSVEGVNSGNMQTSSPSGDNNYNLKTYSKNNVNYIKVPPSETESIKLSMNRLKNDPYYIKVDGVKYYMVVKSKNNNYNIKNILGYGDKRSDLFESLKKLNTNNDDKISLDELKKANIRFVQLSNKKLLVNDTTKDFDINKISYIDIKNIRQSENGGILGTFGYFNVFIKNSDNTVKKIIGQVTFEDDVQLQKLL